MNKFHLSFDEKYYPANQLAASLLDIASARGVDRERLLRGSGIFIEDIKAAKLLSASQLLRLMENAQKLVPGYDCSFQLGRRLFPGTYGAVSEALMHARDLTDALRILTRFRIAICPFVSFTRYSDDEFIYLFFNDAIGCGKSWQFVIECYFSALISSLKMLSGKRIPLYVELPFSRPRYIQEYEENFGLRLTFGQPMLTIKFERKWLNASFNQDSKVLKQSAIQKASLDHNKRITFLDAVRQSLLTTPHTSLQQTAEYFALSPATLKRKLRLHGICFQALHDDVRRQQAIFLIKHKGLNNEQSANQMAFNDIPNFRRAVKRWTGLTPSELKAF